jgi:hypothetical protein
VTLVTVVIFLPIITIVSKSIIVVEISEKRGDCFSEGSKIVELPFPEVLGAKALASIFSLNSPPNSPSVKLFDTNNLQSIYSSFGEFREKINQREKRESKRISIKVTESPPPLREFFQKFPTPAILAPW